MGLFLPAVRLLPRAVRIGRTGRALLWAGAAGAWAAARRRRPRSGRPVAPLAPPAPRQGILKQAFAAWWEADAPRRAAALAYYTIFSIAPLVLIVLAVVGFFFGQESAQAVLQDRIQGVLGSEQSGVVLGMIEAHSRKSATGVAASVVGVVTLLLGATAVVGELQASLDALWGVKEPPSGVLAKVRSRLVSLAFILSLGFLLLVSLLAGTAVSAAGKWLGGLLPVPEAAMQALNAALSFGLVTTLFAAMYKLLPHARVAGRAVWRGAAVTAALFTVGSLLLSLYIGKSGPTSAYGAAGSLLAVLLWTNYCAQIVYLGASFTRAYAERKGSLIRQE